jgi:hypothetical protein
VTVLAGAFILVPGPQFNVPADIGGGGGGKPGGRMFWHAIGALGTVGIVIVAFIVVLVLLVIFLRLRNPGGGVGGWPGGGRMGR